MLARVAAGSGTTSVASLPAASLPGQEDVGAGVEVLLPGLLRVGRATSPLNVGVGPGRDLAQPGPLVARRGLGQAARAQGAGRSRRCRACGWPGCGTPAQPTSVSIFLTSSTSSLLACGQDDLDPVQPIWRIGDFLDALGIGALLQRRDQLVHVEARGQVLGVDLVDEDRPAREVDPQLELLLGRPHGDRARPA